MHPYICIYTSIFKAAIPVNTSSDEIDLDALLNMEHSDSYALLDAALNTSSAQKIGI
jgi:hypothetical protein